jgi:hypothetical protein
VLFQVRLIPPNRPRAVLTRSASQHQNQTTTGITRHAEYTHLSWRVGRVMALSTLSDAKRERPSARLYVPSNNDGAILP